MPPFSRDDLRQDKPASTGMVVFALAWETYFDPDRPRRVHFRQIKDRARAQTNNRWSGGNSQ